jgi:hypothetical protein
VKREVEAHLAAVCQADPYLRKRPIRVDWILDADCAEVSADHPFVASFQSATSKAGLDPQLSGFGAHSDMACRLDSDARRRSISAPAIRLNPINRTNASRSVTLWIARRRSHWRFIAGAKSFRERRLAWRSPEWVQCQLDVDPARPLRAKKSAVD